MMAFQSWHLKLPKYVCENLINDLKDFASLDSFLCITYCITFVLLLEVSKR